MKNKTKKELAELVNTTLEEGDIAGHLAAAARFNRKNPAALLLINSFSNQ